MLRCPQQNAQPDELIVNIFKETISSKIIIVIITKNIMVAIYFEPSQEEKIVWPLIYLYTVFLQQSLKKCTRNGVEQIKIKILTDNNKTIERNLRSGLG